MDFAFGIHAPTEAVVGYSAALVVTAVFAVSAVVSTIRRTRHE